MQIGTPTVGDGEIYTATIRIADQAPYHLILLPGEAEGVSHQKAQEWAASIGGGLPNRVEQALLFAHQREQFKKVWYWSSQQHESDPDYVWCQYFDDGYQYDIRHDGKLRARAVRRLPL